MPTELARNLSAPGGIGRKEHRQKSEVETKEDVVLPPKVSKGRVIRIFRQEAKRALLAHFGNTFQHSSQAVIPYSDPESTNQVASEILGTAKEIVEGDAKPAMTLLNIRHKIEQAATSTREILAGENDDDALDDAVRTIGRGLDVFEREMTPNFTASLVSLDTRTYQRSTIRIRTQEGDIVKLDLRRMDRMSATDMAVNTDEGNLASTEVSLSSRSKLRLKVVGSLNESEVVAIQSVFAQAESLAKELFSGEIAAALDPSAQLDIDTAQFARVSLKLKHSTQLAVSQTALQRFVAVPTASGATGRVDPESVPDTVAPSDDTDVDARSEPQAVSVDAAEQSATPIEFDKADSAPSPATDFDPFIGFLNRLTDFLNELTDDLDATYPATGTFRFEFSRSLKLEILKATLVQTAPEGAAQSTDRTMELVDSLTEAAD